MGSKSNSNHLSSYDNIVITELTVNPQRRELPLLKALRKNLKTCAANSGLAAKTVTALPTEAGSKAKAYRTISSMAGLSLAFATLSANSRPATHTFAHWLSRSKLASTKRVVFPSNFRSCLWVRPCFVLRPCSIATWPRWTWKKAFAATPLTAWCF